MDNLVPVYQQIKEAIKNWIIDGVYKSSQKIPSETELIKEFGVSRLTIRQAVGQLVQEGYLVSRRGKGSFVAISPDKLNFFSKKLCGSIDDLFYHSEKMKTRHVSIEKVTPSPIISQKLKLNPEEKTIHEVTRVRYVDDRPIAVTKSYIQLKYGKFLDKEKLMKQRLIIGILEKEAGITWRHVVQTIEATFASKDLADQLKIASGSPMLRVERIMMTGKRRPIILAISWYRADIFKYSDGFRIAHRRGVTRMIYEGFENNTHGIF
ncbi:MAG: GntR family transcriptional regulator [Deltaproteobacteria bacterium]|nr:GntR family transcriptional regulator [Deltaproteobacteria bacterium]